MSYEKLQSFPVPEKIVIKETDGDTRVPYERVAAYDDKEFELSIREWVVSLKSRFEVRGFGEAIENDPNYKSYIVSDSVSLMLAHIKELRESISFNDSEITRNNAVIQQLKVSRHTKRRSERNA